ncbi:hypothetical protein PLICRDRAFT_41790 [Plicaturopsis crispa FD-325 SS-3]|nr:hypothetical protein PLICRDRAFT_41790 [Plicaturopsis crispa FD-325 SS-3]
MSAISSLHNPNNFNIHDRHDVFSSSSRMPQVLAQNPGLDIHAAAHCDPEPASMSNMYFPSFQGEDMPGPVNMNMNMNNNTYSFALPPPFDFNFDISSNMQLSNNLLVDDSDSQSSCSAPPTIQNHIQGQSYPQTCSPHSFTSEATSDPHSPTLTAHTHSHSSHSPEIHARPIVSAKVAGHTHTMLPPMMRPNPSNTSFDETDNRSFNQRVNVPSPSQADPYAAPFLQEQLGDEKWSIFSARLFERRMCGTKPRSRSRKAKSNKPADLEKGAGATAIDFLVKVEVVKEILRTYVPHPYNPLKSLTHPFPAAPSGTVCLTRSTILALSGWSNTQFSYWARRAEAVSVLGSRDERLSAVAVALQHRLNGSPPASPRSPDDDAYSPSTTSSDRDHDYDANVTGKGLDAIIDDVKKRTGASQFLRGKHCSLDPFGSPSGDDAHPLDSAAPITQTFQATEYTHSPPPPHLTLYDAQESHEEGKQEYRLPEDDGVYTEDSFTHLPFLIDPELDLDQSSLSSGPPSPEVTRPMSRASRQQAVWGNFPLSDSRSDLEDTLFKWTHKQKRYQNKRGFSDDDGDVLPKKKTKTRHIGDAEFL